jgi:hypothetical protein
LIIRSTSKRINAILLSSSVRKTSATRLLTNWRI